MTGTWSHAHAAAVAAVMAAVAAASAAASAAAAVPPPQPGAECDAASFPKALDGVECWGLVTAPSAGSAAECAAACCANNASGCTAWNWCGDPTGKACGHADHGGCYVGRPSQCRKVGGWVGGQRAPAPAPTPAPPAKCDAAAFPTSVSGYECTGLQKAANWSGIESADACQQACCELGASKCSVYQ